VVRVAEVAGAILTGLGVTWALSKIDMGTITIPTLEPPKEVAPPPTVLKLREGDNCFSVSQPGMAPGFTCINGTVRPIGWEPPRPERPDCSPGQYAHWTGKQWECRAVPGGR